MSSILEVHALEKRFGQTPALQGVDLAIEEGEILGLMGANGSGKTTLIRCIAGLVQPDRGEIFWMGRPLKAQSPQQALAQGIAVVYQERSLLPLLSIEENLLLPLRTLGRSLPKRQELVELLDRLGLDRIPLNTLVTNLSIEKRQVLEIAKAFLLRPRLLILDEPTAPLGREAVERLLTLVRSFAREGGTVLFVTHRLGEALNLCHRIAIMRTGKVVQCRPVLSLKADDLIRSMMDESIVDEEKGPSLRSTPRAWPSPKGALLQLEKFQAPGLGEVNLEVAPGEIVGLGGLEGQGQREMLLALFGAIPWRGWIRLLGQTIRPNRPEKALRLGLAYVGGDRARLAFAIRTVGENLLSSSWYRFAKGPLLDLIHAHGAARAIAKELGLVYPGLEAPMASLSGGNQQKVILGRALLVEPRILLLDDPTAGVDPMTRVAFYTLLEERASQGLGILLYSSDEEELLRVAHRVLVFWEGRVIAELRGAEITRENLLAASLGRQPNG